ncbi:MAG: glycerol-3-phosphate acyltransferase [Anaerolineales bacterium]|nr:glycerol-3-phosphate acyltransferase [Anaerolineales bacterium]
MDDLFAHGWFLPPLGYLAGSLPFSLWVSRLVGGIDIREGGSGHATTTNTIRQVGWFPGIVVLALDLGKGFAPSYLAVQGDYPRAVIVLTAALTVIGHCWSLFAGFRGGMGLAAAGGALLAVQPVPALITLAVLITLVLLYGHAARGSAAAGLSIAPVLWLTGFRGVIFWTALAVGWVLAFRFYQQDWDREYRELWLDRER